MFKSQRRNGGFKLTMDDFVYVFDDWRSDLVEFFVFGEGRIQIPSLACLFDFVI